MFKISQVGEQRLESVLKKDKNENPKQILPILTSDIKTLLTNYMEINDIKIDIKNENCQYNILIEVQTRWLKKIGTIPS